jgi:hypothetical protein
VPKVVAVAIRLGNTQRSVVLSLPAPCRHHHILHTFQAWFMDASGGKEYDWAKDFDNQGFLTDEGKFVNRRQAAKLYPEKEFRSGIAYSEDFW